MRSNLGIAETSQAPCPGINQTKKSKNKTGWKKSSQNSDGTCKKQGAFLSVCGFSIPCNLFIFALPGFDFETPVIHVVYVTGRLEVTEDIILELGYGLKEIRDVLVLLNVPDDFGGLCPLVEVD